MIGNASVVCVRPTVAGEDRNHNAILGPPQRLAVPGAAYAPRTSSDVRDAGRNGTITGITVYVPAGFAALPADQWEVDGELYDTDGVPGVWTSPLTGWHAGTEVPARLARG